MPPDEPKVVKPGDSDHPREQVRRAGTEQGAVAASFQARVVLRNGVVPLDAPTVAEIEDVIERAVKARFPEYDVSVSGMRTDR